MWLFSGLCWDLCLWRNCTASTKCPPSRELSLPMWSSDPFDLSFRVQKFAFLTSALPGIELSSFRLCSPVYKVLMAFKPSPFWYLSFFSVPCRCFHSFFFSSCFLEEVLFPYPPPHHHPLSPSSFCKQKKLPTLRDLSLPQFTCPHHLPAEFCDSSCADCFNPQIRFLCVQDGLILL